MLWNELLECHKKCCFYGNCSVDCGSPAFVSLWCPSSEEYSRSCCIPTQRSPNPICKQRQRIGYHNDKQDIFRIFSTTPCSFKVPAAVEEGQNRCCQAKEILFN